MKENVIQRFVSLLSGDNGYFQVAFDFLLTHELTEALGTKG
jgi:hypothetical protein